MNMKWRMVVAAACLGTLVACGGGGGGDSSASTGCAWRGNCGSTTAKEGSYECLGNSLQKCQSGQWITVISCSSLTYSNPPFSYACTCKGGCGTSIVECSYAFNICGGQNYTQP